MPWIQEIAEEKGRRVLMSKGMKIAMAIVMSIAGTGFLVLGAATFGEPGAVLAAARWPFFGIGWVCVGIAIASLVTLDKRSGTRQASDRTGEIEHSVESLPVTSQEQSRPGRIGDSLIFLYKVWKYIVTGALSLLIGFWLVFSPDFRTNPKQFSLRDAAPGFGAILVGVVILGFLAWSFLRRWHR